MDTLERLGYSSYYVLLTILNLELSIKKKHDKKMATNLSKLLTMGTGLVLNENNQYPMNKTSTNSTTNAMTSFDLLVVIILAVLMTIGVVGNACVIYILRKDVGKKKKRYSTKSSITSCTTPKQRNRWFESRVIVLSIVDLLSSCLVPSLFIYGTLHNFRRWHFGNLGCKLFVSLFPFTVSMSQGILVCIPYERYFIIKSKTRRKPPIRVSIWLTGVVIIALLLVSPYTYSLDLVRDRCRSINKQLHMIYVLGNVIRDLVSAILVLIFSVKTVHLLRRCDRKMRKSSNNNSKSPGSKQRQQKSTRVTRIFSTILVSFSVCVIPVDLFQCIFLFFPGHMMKEFGKRKLFVVNTLLATLQISNSVINVFIYSSKHFLRLKAHKSKKKIPL